MKISEVKAKASNGGGSKKAIFGSTKNPGMRKPAKDVSLPPQMTKVANC
jgi:hypothetical protein